MADHILDKNEGIIELGVVGCGGMKIGTGYCRPGNVIQTPGFAIGHQALLLVVDGHTES
jgi:hypothetical protein